ncbi:glycosyltransferase [Thioflavicoccus mobilis 8321]|uniref:Glycosyltransferase n=1 Tax=Thioflavicoccus mobilis 8321 TaxID=765912 RepID=L0H0K5_9GAMM|nr:glycosyltransferase family 4 protein [Thioflavicoccus mobilis]AGA91756.1 glycosyltransferase [Thioflavicoccus mobilis 8321]
MRYKVLLITWACDLDDISEPGVSAIWARELARVHDITLFSVSKPERYGCVQEQFPSLTVIEWKDIRVPKALERFRAIAKPGYFIYYFKARFFLKKLVTEREFDIIHHLSPFSWRYPTPAVKLGIPLVRGPVAGGLKTPRNLSLAKRDSSFISRIFRNTDDLRIRYDAFLKASFFSTDICIFAAPYVAKILEKLPIKKSAIEIELGLADGKVRDNRKKRPYLGAFRLLFVGRITKTKGLQYAIRALERVKTTREIELVAIGDGDNLESCRQLARDLGLEEKIVFMGWQPNPRVLEEYDVADVFIFPSVREPTGGVLLEAISHGLPVITCAHGGPDYIIDDSCGIKVDAKNDEYLIEGLGCAIKQFVENPQLRIDMSRNALERAQEAFNWESKLKRLNEIYDEARRSHNI